MLKISPFAKQMIVLSCVIFSEPVSLTILYPFIYQMVRDFKISEDERDTAYYAGLIAASFSFCQFLTSYFWGLISNRIGRRPVILIGLFGNFVTSILFGFSKSFVWALSTRSLSGLLNGNIAVAKCVLGEITNESNQASAFSIFGFMFGIGGLIAPTLGGLLAQPAEKYPNIFGHFWLLKEFPYLLPCFISSLVTFFGFIVGYFYLIETLGKENPLEEPTKSLPDERQSLLKNHSRENSFYNDLTVTSTSQVVILAEEDQLSSFSETPFTPKSQRSDLSNQATLNYNTFDNRIPNEELLLLPKPEAKKRRFLHFPSFITIIAYCHLAFTSIIFQEVFVFYCNSKHEEGGIGWGSNEVGIVMAIGGGMYLFAQLVAFPLVHHRFRVYHIFQWSQLLHVPMYFSTAFIGDHFYNQQMILWTLFLIHQFWRCNIQAFGFTSVMILINNSCEDKKQLGSVNGIGQSLAALVRALGPYLGGALFSFSIKAGLHYPLNHHFVFVLLAFLCLTGWLLSFLIPKNLEKPRKDKVIIDH